MYEICVLKITKPLEKEIKDLNKQRDTLCSCIRRHNTVKMPVLPKLTYALTQFQSKYEQDYF